MGILIQPDRWGAPQGNPTGDSDGGGGDDGGVEPRLRAIEDRLLKLEVRSETFATKSDLGEAKFAIIAWVVSAVFLAQLLPVAVNLIAKHFVS